MEDLQEVKERLARIEAELGQMRDEVEMAMPKHHHRHMRMRVLPPEVSRHMRASNRELLLAMRSMLDRVIERVDEKEPEAASRRIPVE